MSKKNKAAAKPEVIKDQDSLNFSLYIFLFFTTILLPVFHLNKAFDITLMPRTMLLGVFVFLFGLYFVGQIKEFSPWRHPAVILIFIYLGASITSNILSDAYREGLFDIAKTSMFISMVLMGTMVFYKNENWSKVMPAFVAMAAIVAVSIGAQQYITHVIMGTKQYTKEGLPIVYKVVGIMSHKNVSFSSYVLLSTSGIAIIKGMKFIL